MGRAGVIKIAHKILVGKSEGKKPIWTPRRRCEYNIRMTVKKIVFVFVDLFCGSELG